MSAAGAIGPSMYAPSDRKAPMSFAYRLMAVALPLALSSTALAQPAPAPANGPRTFGVDGAVVLPLGDYGEIATLAVGALGRAEFPIQPKLAITARAGVLYHLTKDEFDGTLLFIPIYGGARYSLGAVPGQGVYLAGEVGITIGYASVDTGFGTASDTETELGATLGAGFRTGALDVRGALFIPDLGEADDPGIMGSVGYDFAAF
jgi:hypothetical protein